MLPAEFESRKAPGSEVPPQLPLLSRTLSPKAPALIAQSFVIGTHNRAPEAGALTKDPLWGAAARRPSPPVRGRKLKQNVNSRALLLRRTTTGGNLCHEALSIIWKGGLWSLFFSVAQWRSHSSLWLGGGSGTAPVPDPRCRYRQIASRRSRACPERSQRDTARVARWLRMTHSQNVQTPGTGFQA